MSALITHGDLDGLIAASIFYSYLRKQYRNITIWTTQPFMLHQALIKVYNTLRRWNRLYIVDLGLDHSTWNKVKSLLKLISSKIRVIWVDHHPQTLQYAKELTKYGITLFYSPNKCASSIAFEICQAQLDDIEFFRKLTVIGELYDKVKDNAENYLMDIAEKLTLALAENPSDEVFKQSLIKLWVDKKQFINDEVLIRASLASKKLKALFKLVKSKISYSSKRLLIVDFRNVNASGYIGLIASKLAELENKIVLIVFTSQYEVIVTSRVPKSLNIDISKPLNEFAKKRGGSGGGHPRAYSIRLPIFVSNNIIEELIEDFEKGIIQ